MFGFGKRQREEVLLKNSNILSGALDEIKFLRNDITEIKGQLVIVRELRISGVKIKQLLTDLTDKQRADHHECLEIMRHNAGDIDTLRKLYDNFAKVTERANIMKRIVGDFITHLATELEALYENLTDELSVREQENSDSGV